MECSVSINVRVLYFNSFMDFLFMLLDCIRVVRGTKFSKGLFAIEVNTIRQEKCAFKRSS